MDLNSTYPTNKTIVDQQNAICPELSNFLGYTTIMIAIAVVISNSIVISASLTSTNLRKAPGNWLITNLAVADLLSGLLVMVPTAVVLRTHKDYSREIFCKIHGFFDCVLLNTSSISLAMISYDRYIAVTKSLFYPSLITHSRVIGMIAYSWIQGIIVSLSPVIGDWVAMHDFQAVCEWKWRNEEETGEIFMIVTGLICFILPSMAMIYFNTRILCSIKQLKPLTVRVCSVTESGRVLGYRGNMDQGGKFCSSSTKKSLISLSYLIFIYFFTFTPFAVVKMIKSFAGRNSVSQATNLFVITNHFMSSAYNPFIYGILRRDYREAISRIIELMKLKLKLS